MPKGQERPDFAVIHGGEGQLTPRMAAHLWSAALFIADIYRDGDQLDLLSWMAHFDGPNQSCKGHL